MRSHLTSNRTEHYIGVYCQTDDNHVNWGCVDIDGKDFENKHPQSIDDAFDDNYNGHDWDAMWSVAGQLHEALDYKRCTAWTERTTNGIHVWVFPEQPVLAVTMRRALLAACTVIGYQPKEVNPKQETLNPDKPFGNYVRLPYYGALANGTPIDRFVIDEDGPMTVEEFTRTATTHRTPIATLEAMAALYTPPAPKVVDVAAAESTAQAFQMLVPILPNLVNHIFAEGALGDRSNTLVKVALELRSHGWRAQAVYIVIDALDQKLGKFVDRDDREEQLLRLVEDYGT